jgi:putative ubiquitin-RnfH superfamily antitoxin RatB of RatAB toxin-antitoxin module
MGIKIEVAYAKPESQIIINLELEQGCTIAEAIEKSGILLHFPEINLNTQQVGVFGEPKRLTDEVKRGDRVEIYRELVMDPKDARRQRASNRSRLQNKK